MRLPILNVLRKVFFGLYGNFLYRRKLKTFPCDILFLYSWHGEAIRTKNLSDSLERHGFKITHETIPSRGIILRKRLLSKTMRVSPFKNGLSEYYAAFVVHTYHPKILLTFDDGTCYTVFLKHEMEKIGGKIINVAHGVTGDSCLFTNFFFHYYFVFGQSSADAVLRQKNRFGTTKLVKTGSYLIGRDDILPINNQRNTILFCSTWLPDQVKDILLRNMRLFAAWVKGQQDYEVLIKHHPLEDESIIRLLLKDVPRVTFLPRETPMKDALASASLAIIFWSVSSVEAALMNRPTVIINDSDMPDFLEIEDYFLARARTVPEIHARITETFSRYDEFLENSNKYVKRHLGHTNDSIPFITKLIESIYHNREDFEYIIIPETLESVYKHNNPL